MKTKLDNFDISATAKALIKGVLRTRNTVALSALTKAAIFQRDVLLGKDPAEPVHKFNKIKDSKSRARVQNMVTEIAGLDDRKAVSLLCAACINQRKAVRAALKAEADQAEVAPTEAAA